MTTKNNYVLKAHEIFFQRTVELNQAVKALSRRLSYLYLNDRASRSDPYERFSTFVRQGRVSHHPLDPKIQRWIRAYEPDGD